MSFAEHRRAMDDYRMNLIAGRVEDDRLPLSAMDEWEITRVTYTDSEGSVTVATTTTYDTVAGPLAQNATYTFRLNRGVGKDGQWRVVRYDTVIER